MADVNCYGTLGSTRYQVIPLLNTAQTENAEEATSTDSNFVGTAQAAGTFGAQMAGGFTVTQAGIICENDWSYSYILSAGKIKAGLPCGTGIAGGSQGLPAPIPYPKALQAGDTVVTMASAVSDRTAAVTVACTSGEYHIFSVTPSGSGLHEFVSILDGTSSVGETLQGRTISHWFASSGNNDAEVTSPVYLLNGSGVPVGSVSFTSSGGAAGAAYQPCRHQVALNFRLAFRSDA